MVSYINIIKGNYLQYARSYSFLITIGLSLLIALSIIPAPDANYSTLRFGEFTGVYNTTWISLVTAIFSSIFLSLCGFFLISGSIKKDIESRIGHIIGSTSISNTQYILTKISSNFFILFSILAIIFIVSIVLFFLYGSGYSFALIDFVIPYVIIAIPSLVFVTCLAVTLEIVFPRMALLQYGVFFVIFFSIIFLSTIQEADMSFDIFGIQHPLNSIASQIHEAHPNESGELTLGFVAEGTNPEKKVEISSVSFPNRYLLSRLFWILLSVLIAIVASKFFHRFDIKEKPQQLLKFPETSKPKNEGFQLKNMHCKPEFSPQLLPLIKAEILLLIRKISIWIWIITLSGMVAMLFLRPQLSHQFVLPILWFLQVAVLSDLISKDYTLRTHYFTASAYKPLRRLFISRIIAAFLLAIVIAAPLLLRLVLNLDFSAVLNIVLGAIFIVLLTVFLGVLTKSKKLFEILFFFILYCNINLVAITDYFGAVHNSIQYTGFMILINILLFASANFLKMNYE